MVKTTCKLTAILVFSHFATKAYAKTFSCGGAYEDRSGVPSSSMHQELDYNPQVLSEEIQLKSEDSKYYLIGSLKISQGKEFLNIELISKESGLVTFNNNSQLGQPYTNPFNFVFLGLKNVGAVTASRGVLLDASVGSFQCQSY
jgi:hypothetical protein